MWSRAVAQRSHISTSSSMFNNETQKLIMELVHNNDVKYGMSTVLLVAFNMASAAIVVGLVLYDARSLAKSSVPTKTGYFQLLKHANKRCASENNISTGRHRAYFIWSILLRWYRCHSLWPF